MKAEELIAYALRFRAASDMQPGSPASITPLMLTEDQMNEVVDGTGLTAAQWLRAANAGILTLPNWITMPERCCTSHVQPYERPGWCLNAKFDGCEPCCDECPDYEA